MTRIIHAELIRLLRRRTIVVTAAAALAFSIVATLTVFSSAGDAGAQTRRGGTTLAALAVGKLAGILVVAAGVVALAEVFTFALSVVMAPTKDVAVGNWFSLAVPGQVLASLIRGGTVELGMSRAVFTTVLYTLVAATVTLVLVSRRDVTA